MRALRNLIPPLYLWLLAAGVGYAVQTSVFNFQAPPLTSVETESRPTATSSDAPAPAFQAPEPRDYAADLARLSERPLFSETRRIPEPEVFEEEIIVEAPPAEEYEEPPVIEPEPVYVPPPQVPDIRFMGFVRSGATLEVLISTAETDRERWVSVNDLVSDWVITDVTETSLRLQNGTFEHVVEFNQ